MTEFAFSNRAYDLWLREIQSSERRLGEGATTGRQSAHQTLAPTDPPPGRPIIVLPPESYSVS